MNKGYHVPVMKNEVINGLKIKSGGIYLDCTLGGGGHFFEIAGKLDKDGILIGIDRDNDSIQKVNSEISGFAPLIIIEKSRFSEFEKVLVKHKIKNIDGILIDLGVSSYQIDTPARGFTYMKDGNLDMRMDTSERERAALILKRFDEKDLCWIFRNYGEVRNPSRAAKTIVSCRKENELETSRDLKICLEKEYGAPLSFKLLSKIFQALRITVNRELEELKTCLEKTRTYLNKGGRLAVISYHSIEDRIIKRFLIENEKECRCPPDLPVCRCDGTSIFKRINRKVIRPLSEEIINNSRARSAKLRIAEKLV